MASRETTRLWLCMQDSGRTRTLSRALAKNTGMTVFMGPVSENDGDIDFIVADDAHSGRIAEARRQAAPNQKALLVTGGAKQLAKADLYMLHDTDAGTLFNAIDGLRVYRDYEIALGRAADLRVGAIKSLAAAVMVLGSALGPGLTGWLIDVGIGIETQFVGFSLYFAVASGLMAMGVAKARRHL